MPQGSGSVDPDLALSHGQLATRLKLGKGSAHRLEREPKKAADRVDKALDVVATWRGRELFPFVHPAASSTRQRWSI
jgi:hypothetical protein